MIKIEENVTENLEKLLKFDYDKQLTKLSIDGISVINERIEKDVDIDGKKFKQLSPGYAKMKASFGKNIRDFLQFSGEMLRSITFKVKNKTAIIEFPKRKHTNSNATIEQIAQRNHKIRKFFGFNDRESEALINKHLIKPYEEFLK